MRILYFHQYFKTRQGSGGTRSYEMAKYLVDHGYRVTMVYSLTDRQISPLQGPYSGGVRRGSVDGIDLIEVNVSYSGKMSFLKRAWVFLRFSLKSCRIAFTEEYDLLFATSTPLTAGIPGIAMKMLGRKRPFIFEVRDLWPELPREMGVITNPFILWVMGVLECMSYNKADACVALSPGIADGIQKRLRHGIPVELIPNGADLELFTPSRDKRLMIPGAESGDMVCIFTGAHGIANGLDAALDVAAVLMPRGRKDIKMVFIGDGMMKKQLVERVKRESLSNCIFLDSVPKVELTRYLQSADVGLMLLANVPAFYRGTSPNKFFDYLAMGLPILNNYPGWLAGLISEADCGMAVPPDDPTSFADALESMAADRDSLRIMGANARKLAEDAFDRLKLAEQMRMLMERIHEDYIHK